MNRNDLQFLKNRAAKAKQTGRQPEIAIRHGLENNDPNWIVFDDQGGAWARCGDHGAIARFLVSISPDTILELCRLAEIGIMMDEIAESAEWSTLSRKKDDRYCQPLSPDIPDIPDKPLQQIICGDLQATLNINGDYNVRLQFGSLVGIILMPEDQAPVLRWVGLHAQYPPKGKMLTDMEYLLAIIVRKHRK